MLKLRRYILSLIITLILAVNFYVPTVTYAQTAPVQSQMLNSSITVSDTTGFTITGSIELNNNSTKGYDNNSLIVKLLQPGKSSEVTANGHKFSQTAQALIIDYQKTTTISLMPGQKITQQFSLKYPALIETGDYIVVAELLDQDSTAQSTASLNVSLNGNGGFLQLDSLSCSIVVGSKSFSPSEGPTINKNERGTASCTVRNAGQKPIQARLNIPYAPFSVVENSGNLNLIEANNQLITFEPNQERKVAFILPNNLSPTVYEGLLQLIDGSGQKVSANIPFRWIIPGESAKFQNFDTNKSYYKNGEVAKISATILGSADTGWRGQGANFSPEAGTDINGAKAVVRITNDKGELCGEKTDQLPSTKDKPWDEFIFDVPITQDCNNPKVEAQILSSTDQSLAEVTKRQTSTDADLKSAGITPPSEKAQYSKWPLIGAIAAVVVIILSVVVIFIIRKKRNTTPPASSPGPPMPPTTTTSVIIILLLLASLFAGFKYGILETEFSVPEVSAQTGTAKAPINSTNPNTRNTSLHTGPQSVAHNKEIWSNIRDFAQNNTGGDSQIQVEPNCAKIQIRIKGSTGSNHTCGNWGNGLPMAVYFDGAPIAVEGVDPMGHEKYQPIPMAPFSGATNNFDILSRNTTSAQMETTFFVTPTQAQRNSPGKHTLSIRAGTSYAIIHPPGMPLQEYATTFGTETTTRAPITNCDAQNSTCYMEIKHEFTCKPPVACNEECTNNLDCTGNPQGCTTCRDNGAGKKTCQPPPACNAQCATTEDCASNLAGCTTCRPDPTGQKTCQPAPPQCNAACGTDRDCFGALNGCTSCVEGACKPPPACGTACTSNRGCEAAKDGCNTCVSGTCRVQPSCGTACTTRADCAGAKEGCVECLEGTCTNFNQGMCGCDGF